MGRGNVVDMFNVAVEKFASLTAIDSPGGRMTYRELDERSNRLASLLVSLGTPKGSLIAILAGDTVEVVVAMIGILKAGCAFIPLDARTPPSRIELLLAEASPHLVLAESKFIEMLGGLRLSESGMLRVIQIDEGAIDEGGIDAGARKGLELIGAYAECRDAQPHEIRLGPDDLCYIYFTSGSTGRPKAIAGRVKGIDHFIRWETETLELGEGVRVSQLITPSFDAFLRDIFVPLSAGGTACIPEPSKTMLGPAALADWIDAERINLVHCVTSLFRAITEGVARPGMFSSLRYVLISGERLLPSDVGKWFDSVGERVQLVNLYGPTETTMTKFAYFVKPSDKGRRFIPIGKPMRGAAAILLDQNMRVCPVGAVGEIYIRTPYRSLGYYNLPDLTAEVFVANPFSNDPTDIIYKTGDLGRQLEDGNYEFIGRRDHQLKIRGVRVEVEEIESLLRTHQSVIDAVVVDKDDPDGNKSIYAYVILRDATPAISLREFLSSKLPDVMIPSDFIVLDKLPRTLSNKVDRTALPPIEQALKQRELDLTPPRSESERRVAEIWSQVLGVERVGVHESFFALGGHSLLAMSIVARVQQAFNIELPLGSLFEALTVAGMAEQIELMRWAGQRTDATFASQGSAREEIEL